MRTYISSALSGAFFHPRQKWRCPKAIWRNNATGSKEGAPSDGKSKVGATRRPPLSMRWASQ